MNAQHAGQFSTKNEPWVVIQLSFSVNGKTRRRQNLFSKDKRNGRKAAAARGSETCIP
jgi:hypothetical protein